MRIAARACQSFNGIHWVAIASSLRRAARATARIRRKLQQSIFPPLLAIAAGLSLALGLTNAEPAKVIAVTTTLVFCSFIASRTEIGLMVLVILQASAIYPSALPKPFTVGGMGFGPGETVLLIMLVTVLSRHLVNRRPLPSSPMTLPLLLLMVSVLASVITSWAMRFSHASWDFTVAYNVARPMVFYMAFFVTAIGLRTEREMNTFLRLAIWCSIVVSLLMVLQSVLGRGHDVFIGGGRATQLYTLSATDEETGDLLRTMPPGIAPICVLFPMTLALAVYARKGTAVLKTLTASLLGVGLVFTFFRSYWIATIIAILIIWLASGWAAKRKLIVFTAVTFGITIVAAIVLAGVVKGKARSQLENALVSRVESMFSVRKTLRSSSLQNRLDENRLAWQAIRRNVVFGIGAGNPIGQKALSDPLTGAQRIVFRRWMHNSYLELWLIHGLLGFASFIWLSIAFLIRSFCLFRIATRPEWRALSIAAFAAYIGFLQRSITQMHITHDIHQILTVAILWGIVEALWRLNGEEQASLDSGVRVEENGETVSRPASAVPAGGSLVKS